MKRLQIDISESSFVRLQDLKKKTECSSYAEVTQRAYKMLEFVLNSTYAGGTLSVTDKDGETTTIELL